jgi:hypothetical protein
MYWFRKSPHVALIIFIVALSGSVHMAAADTDVVVASGTLDGQLLGKSLFHIGAFWIRVPANTEFYRWLSQGLDHHVVITLTTNVRRFGDEKNLRILSGTLIQETAPAPTPNTTNVVGSLPEGDLPFVHILFLKDEVTGTLGAATFETADFVTASKFNGLDNKHVDIVIQLLGDGPKAVGRGRS